MRNAGGEGYGRVKAKTKEVKVKEVNEKEGEVEEKEKKEKDESAISQLYCEPGYNSEIYQYIIPCLRGYIPVTEKSYPGRERQTPL
jgi:hypothetical protein